VSPFNAEVPPQRAVLLAIAAYARSNITAVAEYAAAKRHERGGFTGRVRLESD
jgi:hypothetical protein